MRRLVIAAIALALALASCSSHPAVRSAAVVTSTTRPSTTTSSTSSSTTTTTSVPPRSGPPWSVRQSVVELDDPTRSTPARGTVAAHPGRWLRTTLLWPVTSSGTVAPGSLPLFVFAHGYKVQAATYAALLDGIARAGVVVAAPDFPGESTAYPGLVNESDLTQEPCDIEFVATQLERHPPSALRNTLPGAPLIVGGHSDGATAAAFAGYASSCSTTPSRGVVAMSPNDVPMSAAYRFGTPPPLLAMSGAADEINPLPNTLALYHQVPGPAWLVTVDGGRHLATFTTDPDLARLEACVVDFVVMVTEHDANARRRLTNASAGRVHVTSR
jgi:hypothetical protein